MSRQQVVVVAFVASAMGSVTSCSSDDYDLYCVVAEETAGLRSARPGDLVQPETWCYLAEEVVCAYERDGEWTVATTRPGSGYFKACNGSG